ncbi:MAG TPA: hypothetical protein VH062_01065 [Polyangiaceae bacterium]|nr:hypothetical protein [Polyangiaceae bacterium]
MITSPVGGAEPAKDESAHVGAALAKDEAPMWAQREFAQSAAFR